MNAMAYHPATLSPLHESECVASAAEQLLIAGVSTFANGAAKVTAVAPNQFFDPGPSRYDRDPESEPE